MIDAEAGRHRGDGTGGRRDRIFVRGGFADVNAGGLTILADQAIPLAEVDPAMLAQEIRDAEEDVADAKEPAVRAAAEQKLHQLKEVQAAIAVRP